MENNSKIVLMISGMHRSGTSTIAGVISRLGAALPKNLLPPQPDNPKGFFEPSLIVDLNDRILAESGTTWWDWRSVDNDWSINPRAAGYIAEAKTLLAQEFGDDPFIVLKDPRLAKLLPFWQHVLESAGYRVLHIIPVRHPNEVAASLQRREARSPNMVKLTWLRHVIDAELFTRGQPRAFMLWHQFVADWEKSLVDVAARLGFRWPRLTDAARAEIGEFLSKDLIHHRESRDAPDDCPDCNRYVAAAYGAVIQLAGDPESEPATEKMDVVRADFLCTERVYGPYFADMDLIHRGLERHRNDLLAQVARRDTHIAAIDARLAALSEELAGERRTREADHAVLAGVQLALEQANTHVGNLEAAHHSELAACQATLSALSAQLHEATQERDTGVQENESLKEALRGAEARQAQLSAQFDAATQELAGLHTDQALLAATIADLQRRLGRASEEARGAAERLSAHNALSLWQKIGTALKGTSV